VWEEREPCVVTMVQFLVTCAVRGGAQGTVSSAEVRALGCQPQRNSQAEFLGQPGEQPVGEMRKGVIVRGHSMCEGLEA
jgi:hypothetical protein